MPLNDLIDVRQTSEYASYMQSLGWEIGKLAPNHLAGEDLNTYEVKNSLKATDFYYFVKKFPLLPFSFIKIHRPPVNIPLSAVKTLAKKQKAIFVKISPSKPIPIRDRGSAVSFPPPIIYKFYSPHKLHIDDDPMIATKTIWIDLSKSEEELLNNMKPKTRYNINKCKRSIGLRVGSVFGNKITQEQIKHIYWLWKQNNRRLKLFTPRINELIHIIKSFGRNCFVTTVYRSCHSLQAESLIRNLGGSCFRRNDIPNQLSAFCLVLLSPTTAFYWHNASTAEGRKLFAPTLCAWEAILQSKKLGKKIFDFEGIFDERYAQVFRKWKGFSRFKEGFI